MSRDIVTTRIPFGWSQGTPLQAVTITDVPCETGSVSKVELRDINGATLITLSVKAGDGGYTIEIPAAGPNAGLRVRVG